MDENFNFTSKPTSTLACKNKEIKRRRESKSLFPILPIKASKKHTVVSQFGQIKGLRLPRRNDVGQIKGYDFVEFVTKQEALNAKKALSSTHFYGRRLVLDWAKDDNSMEELRYRSGVKFMEKEKVGSC